MLFHQRKHFLHVGRAGDGLFDILVGKKLLADDPAQAFGYLLLAFGEDAVECKTKYLFWPAGMEKELEGHPDSKPVYKSGYKRNGIQPPADCCHARNV